MSVLDDIAQYMTTLYSDAETFLIESLAWRMERDMTVWADDTARVRLINEMRAVTVAEVRRLAATRTGAAEWAAEAAVESGAAGIRDVLAHALPATTYGAPFGQAGLHAVAATSVDLASRLTEVEQRILRLPSDIWQKFDAVLVTRKLTSSMHTIQFQREMIGDWYRYGIPGFTDVSGRTWRVGSYVEMAARTGAQRAATEGRRAQLLTAGMRLGVILELHSACDRCAPWAGKVVSLDGGLTGLQQLTDMVTGRPIIVDVAGTIEQARAEGWQHPSCRGSLSAYVPGRDVARFERTNTGVQNTAEQNLRETERDIRQAKRDLAINPGDRDARRALLDGQAEARALVARHGLARRYWRESLTWSGDRIPPSRRTKPTTPVIPPRPSLEP